MTKVIFATDLHGNHPAYDRLFEKAAALKAGAVVLGGDILPLPGRHSDPLLHQRTFTRGWLAPRLTKFHRESPAIRVFGMLGNDDWSANEAPLAALEEEESFFPLHMRAHKLDDERWIAGYSCVPITPFYISDYDRFDSRDWEPSGVPSTIWFSDGDEIRNGTIEEVRSRPTIEEDLAELAGQSDPSKTIYVTHSPPADTKLDLMHGDVHIGSRAIRAFIEKHQPPLTLHGHIHESPKLTGVISEKIGRTLSVNPGDSRTRLRAVFIDPADPQPTPLET